MRHGLCMCAIQKVNGRDKSFKFLCTGYGRRCQAHRFVSRIATLLGFSRSTVSHLCQGWSTTQRTSNQHHTVGSNGVNLNGVNMDQQLCGTLSTPYGFYDEWMTGLYHHVLLWACLDDWTVP